MEEIIRPLIRLFVTKEISRATGLCHGTVWRFKSGERCSPETLEKLIQWLDGVKHRLP